MILFAKTSFPISEGGGDFSDVYLLDSAANGISFELDNGGNNGLWDNRSETTIVEFKLLISFDGGTNYQLLRGGFNRGAASCPIGKDGQPNCISIWGLKGLPPEENSILRRVKLEVYLTSEIPSEKTIQIKNYKVYDDL